MAVKELEELEDWWWVVLLLLVFVVLVVVVVACWLKTFKYLPEILMI